MGILSSAGCLFDISLCVQHGKLGVCVVQCHIPNIYIDENQEIEISIKVIFMTEN